MAWKSFADVVGRRINAWSNNRSYQVRVAQVLATADDVVKKHLGQYAPELKAKMLRHGVLTFVSPEAPALAELRLIESMLVAETNRRLGYTAVIRLAYNIEILSNWR
jgi:hypothetical protein